jgi:hypothetical protein
MDIKTRIMKNSDCYQNEHYGDFQQHKNYHLKGYLKIPAIIYRTLTTI